MLTARRGGAATSPNLSREEFLAVCLASWLDLTLSVNSSIVRDLASTGPSPEERLRQIGERVGLPAHGRAHNYFLLAHPVSVLLICLERGDYSSSIGARALPIQPELRDRITTVVHHWQQISGRDLKAPRTTLSPASLVSSVPSSVPMSVAPSAPTNGRVPAGTP